MCKQKAWEDEADKKMNTIMNSTTWHELLMQIVDIPIKRYPNNAYTDAEVREILTIMRKRMDSAQANPNADDPFETDSDDYRDMYDTFQHIADQRGIIV